MAISLIRENEIALTKLVLNDMLRFFTSFRMTSEGFRVTFAEGSAMIFLSSLWFKFYLRVLCGSKKILSVVICPIRVNLCANVFSCLIWGRVGAIAPT